MTIRQLIMAVLISGLSSFSFAAHGLEEALSEQYGCRSGRTNSNSTRESCYASAQINAPSGHMLLQRTIVKTAIGEKGTGFGCGQPVTEYWEQTESGYGILTAISHSANARSDHGANSIIVGIGGGGLLGELFNELGTRGAVECKLSVTVKPIE